MRHPVVEEDLNFIASASLNWDSFSDKTILVSGANGFLPAYMVEALLHLSLTKKVENVKIIGLVRDKDKALARFADYHNRNDLEFIYQDVCSPIHFDGNLDYIIHAASQASPKYYSTDPVGTISANVLGTNNLLALAQRKQVQGFLFFSSSEIYGQVDDSQIPTAENYVGRLDPATVRACYGESKRCGEAMCVAWSHQYNIPVKIVRPFHTYGPGVRLDDGRVFADFISDIVNNRNIIMKSDGSATRAFCYLADAIVGFFTVLLKGEVGEAYNIGNPSAEVSILELAEKLAAIFPEKNLQVIKDESAKNDNYLKSNVSRNAPNIDKVMSIGWEPSTNIIDGFKRTIETII
jgi:UDP-glucuronate decarboxylase